MADKVIPFKDPSKKINLAAFLLIKQQLEEVNFEELQSLVIISTVKDATNCQIYGLDFDIIGRTQAILQTAATELLREQYGEDDL